VPQRDARGPVLDRLVRDTLEICAIPAPTFAEEERAVAFAERLRATSLPVRRDAAGNVLARVGGPGPALLVAAHLDTVFPAETPLAPHRDGDVLRGPGIGDNAAALAAVLHLARRLVDASPTMPVVLAATVGEEGRGDLRGIRAVLDEEPTAAVVAVEGHGIDSLITAGVGSARFEAIHRGPGGHSWGDRGRASAVHSLLAAALRAVDVARPVAANIGVIGGGTSINTIAAEARLEIDLRSEDDGGLEAAARRVAAALREAPRDIEAEVRAIGRRGAGRLPPDHALLRAARAARAAVGLLPAREESASTDANAAYARGIPAITVGVTSGDNVHRTDEWIRIGPLARGVGALEHLVLGVSGATRVGAG
jgi:acetylornithine deacetylase/succinyl-diaminopimelate desuccinylase-like protein